MQEYGLEDVFLALTAIKDMAARGNGGKGWSPEEFRARMGLKEGQFLTLRDKRMNGPSYDPSQPKDYSGCYDASHCRWGSFSPDDPLTINLDLQALRLYRGAGQRGNPIDHLMVTLVHELAHRWDFAAGNSKSKELWGATHCTVYGAEYECGAAGVPSAYARRALRDPTYQGDRAKEYWAESVAAYVYPNAGQYAGYARTFNENYSSYRYARDSFK